MSVAGRAADVTYARILRIALPVVLSNATVPLQGAIDTAIIGNLGDATALAAVTLGATATTLVFASFNFLQMGTSGLAAQALGAGDRRRVVNTLLRALVLAGALGLLLNLAAGPLLAALAAFFEGSAEAEAAAGAYLRIRLWGAPAELAGYALIGWFAGQEQTRRLFELQAVLSVCNIALTAVFALGLGWGVEGIALGTTCAAHVALGVGLWRVRRRIAQLHPDGFRPEIARILNAGELALLARLNRDIFIRTICLTGSFAWMARLGSTQGDVVLAANGVLMLFIHVSAYALDGFAMAAETLVGQALGARDRARLRHAVVRSTLAALGLAAGFAALASLMREPVIALFTADPAVRAAAADYALWATVLPLAGVLAYQLDGVFIGAADGPAMRNAMLVSAAVFVPTSWYLTHFLGNHGLWLALWTYMLTRAASLAVKYPALEERAHC